MTTSLYLFFFTKQLINSNQNVLLSKTVTFCYSVSFWRFVVGARVRSPLQSNLNVPYDKWDTLRTERFPVDVLGFPAFRKAQTLFSSLCQNRGILAKLQGKLWTIPAIENIYFLSYIHRIYKTRLNSDRLWLLRKESNPKDAEDNPTVVFASKRKETILWRKAKVQHDVATNDDTRMEPFSSTKRTIYPNLFVIPKKLQNKSICLYNLILWVNSKRRMITSKPGL